MDNKTEIINQLSAVLGKWIVLVAGLSQEQIHQPLLPSEWTAKDVVAHLWSWQQASVARAEAALRGGDPHYPDWWVACGPDPNEDVDRTNAFLYSASKNKAWNAVYSDWKGQFERYLELLRQVPEDDLVTAGKFAWLGGSALSASALGSWDHHQEHYEALTSWLMENKTG